MAIRAAKMTATVTITTIKTILSINAEPNIPTQINDMKLWQIEKARNKTNSSANKIINNSEIRDIYSCEIRY